MATRTPRIRVGQVPVVIRHEFSPKDGLVGFGVSAETEVSFGSDSPTGFRLCDPGGGAFSSGSSLDLQPTSSAAACLKPKSDFPMDAVDLWLPHAICTSPEIVLAVDAVDKKGKGKAKRPFSASTSKFEDSPRPKRGRQPLGVTNNA